MTRFGRVSVGAGGRLHDIGRSWRRDDAVHGTTSAYSAGGTVGGTAHGGAEERLRPAVRLTGAVTVAAITVVVLGTHGLLTAVAGSCIAWFLLGRLEPTSVRRRRERALRDLPIAADLLAACLIAGAPLDRAVAAVGTALDGPIAAAFDRAGSALALGAPVDEAVAPWQHDAALAGLEPVARVLVRAAASGSAAGPAIVALAVDLRSERRWRIDETARRAGVRATAPLGVCFLPAFVLAGVVPVVIAGVRSVVL